MDSNKNDAVKPRQLLSLSDGIVRNSRLRGEEIKLVVTGVVGERAWHHYFVGQLKGDRISGEVIVSNGNSQRTFPWTATRTR